MVRGSCSPLPMASGRSAARAAFLPQLPLLGADLSHAQAEGSQRVRAFSWSLIRTAY